MRILVAVDGSAPANRAVRHAIRIVGLMPDGDIVLLNVQDPAAFAGADDIAADMPAPTDNAALSGAAKTALRRPVGLCTKAAVAFSTRVEIGPVAPTIDRIARLSRADQIVMGCRGLGAIGRLLLGSVASGVVERSRVPVTLVK